MRDVWNLLEHVVRLEDPEKGDEQRKRGGGGGC